MTVRYQLFLFMSQSEDGGTVNGGQGRQDTHTGNKLGTLPNATKSVVLTGAVFYPCPNPLFRPYRILP